MLGSLTYLLPSSTHQVYQQVSRNRGWNPKKRRSLEQMNVHYLYFINCTEHKVLTSLIFLLFQDQLFPQQLTTAAVAAARGATPEELSSRNLIWALIRWPSSNCFKRGAISWALNTIPVLQIILDLQGVTDLIMALYCWILTTETIPKIIPMLEQPELWHILLKKVPIIVVQWCLIIKWQWLSQNHQPSNTQKTDQRTGRKSFFTQLEPLCIQRKGYISCLIME